MMPKARSVMNRIVCWLFGHEWEWTVVEGKVGMGFDYECQRCGAKEPERIVTAFDNERGWPPWVFYSSCGGFGSFIRVGWLSVHWTPLDGFLVDSGWWIDVADYRIRVQWRHPRPS